MRWDKDYKNPEVINDPTIIPAYGVTDEERARWNAKQDALEYDAEPTPYSDKLMISGAIFNALERYKVQTVEASKAFFWGVAEGLGQTQTACETAQVAAETARDAAETAAIVSNTNRLASENSARSAADSKQEALARAGDAAYSAEQAISYAADSLEHAIDSEAWSVGTREGVAVDPDDPAYHHNAKYYADLTREVIDDTITSEAYTWSSDKISGIFDVKADLVDGKIPAAQLPSYVDDVEEYASVSVFPVIGESGKLYVALDTNRTYRWSGSIYVEVSESLALGETSSTAYAGSKGKQNADNITALQNSVSDIEDKIPSTASSSNQFATNADLPTALDELTDDATHRLVTDTEKTDWNSKAAGNHNHDDRYYTETEVDTLLSGKAAAVHNHDDRYYTETEIDTMFAGVSFTTSGGDIYINW